MEPNVSEIINQVDGISPLLRNEPTSEIIFAPTNVLTPQNLI